MGGGTFNLCTSTAFWRWRRTYLGHLTNLLRSLLGWISWPIRTNNRKIINLVLLLLSKWYLAYQCHSCELSSQREGWQPSLGLLFWQPMELVPPSYLLPSFPAQIINIIVNYSSTLNSRSTCHHRNSFDTPHASKNLNFIEGTCK